MWLRVLHMYLSVSAPATSATWLSRLYVCNHIPPFHWPFYQANKVINWLIDWLIDWKLNVGDLMACLNLIIWCSVTVITPSARRVGSDCSAVSNHCPEVCLIQHTVLTSQRSYRFPPSDENQTHITINLHSMHLLFIKSKCSPPNGWRMFPVRLRPHQLSLRSLLYRPKSSRRSTHNESQIWPFWN